MHCFVYYDVPAGHADAVRERVRAMQDALGGRGRLMRRPTADAGVATWMEVYEGVDDDFVARLATSAERHGLATLAGPRHVERFVDVA